MARVLVLTDRLPADPDWKGAFAWNLIRNLAESQHQVLVLTTRDLSQLNVSHPLLTVARPASSWRIDHLPKFLQAIFLFKPEVVHTFAPRPAKLWPALSMWPVLSKAVYLLPRFKRYVCLFEATDFCEKDATLGWLQESDSVVVFTSSHARELAKSYHRPIEVAPVDWETGTQEGSIDVKPDVLIPAAVSEWENPQAGLRQLVTFLTESPDKTVRVIGGWGELNASERREGWQILKTLATRVKLSEPISAERFSKELQSSDGLWTECLARDSWRLVFSTRVAQSLSKAVYGPQVSLLSGSSANFLSRLYAHS